MAYTRDWSKTTPIDHTKFKDVPGAVRNIREDLEERLASIVYGFTAGETVIGIKLGKLITVGTGNAAIPTGTGNEAAINVFAKTIDGKVELCTIDADGNVIQLTKGGKIPLDVSSRLANDAYLIARNQANTDNVNVLKVNTANEIELASHPIGPNTGPSADLQYTPKGYVDKEIADAVTDLGVTTGPAAGGIPKLDSNGYITPFLRVYDTGADGITWAANTNYTVTHNFNTTKVIVQFMFRANNTVPWKIVTGHRDNGIIGVTAYEVNANDIKFNMENFDFKGGTATSSGQYRVIVLALA